MHLRLDRIEVVKSLNTPSKHFSKVSKYQDKFDTADYSNKLFNMYTGESGQIELCCDNRLIDDILEKFGEDIPIKIFNENKFIFKADVELSNGLVSWIMQYGSDIKVVSPKLLSDAVIQKAKDILTVYE